MQGIKITAEGFRQLMAAFDNPQHASFTADAFELILADAVSNYNLVVRVEDGPRDDVAPGKFHHYYPYSHSSLTYVTAIAPGLQPALELSASSTSPRHEPVPRVVHETGPTEVQNDDPVEVVDEASEVFVVDLPALVRKGAEAVDAAGVATKPTETDAEEIGGEPHRSIEIGKDAPSKDLDLRILDNLKATLDEIAAVSHQC